MKKDPREIKQQFMAFCALAQVQPLEDVVVYLSELDRYDTVGPIIDPTNWRRQRKALDRDRELFSAFLKFRRLLDAVVEAEQAETEVVP